ncbi:hypothetical protein TrVFT333_002189 [Trichoderma virens FT-333]|nr:hypothetical protein TrVFT333_002189 [Trichoderma virens FT-333]
MEQDQKLPLIDPATVDKHVSPVDKITFSHDVSLVASTSLNDNTLMVWSATTGHCIQRCPGDVIENVSFSHDCSLVASVWHGSVSMEEQACIWKIDTGVCISHFPTPTEHQALRTFSHDLEFLATSTGETVDLWHVRKGICIRSFKEDLAIDMRFSDDSTFLGAATGSGTVSLWETGTGEPIYQHCIPEPDTEIICIVFSHDLALIAFATSSGDIHIICRDNSKSFGTTIASIDTASLAFNHDSSHIGATLRSGETFVWRVDNGQRIHMIHPWSMGQYFNIDICAQHAFISAGSDDENSESITLTPCCGYCHGSNGEWIMWGEHQLLKLPKRYQGARMTASDTAIVLEYGSGRVIIITTSARGLPDFVQAESHK